MLVDWAEWLVRRCKAWLASGTPVLLARPPHALAHCALVSQVLECDLTADDEPAWRAVKKEVHQVL